MSTTILPFILDYFQENRKTKLFKKSKKKKYSGANLGPFCSNLVKNKFSWEGGLCQFLNIPIIYHNVKNQKKIMSLS